jgi:flagellar biogenesis protein FliO
METELLLKAFFSLVLVIGLIGLLALLYKRYGIERNLMNKGKPKKLKIEEFIYLDSRRKLVLVKKDEHELLILLSPTGEIIIPTGLRPAVKHGPHPQRMTKPRSSLQ